MINNVSLVGRLTKDVDLRYTQNGVAVGNFTLACNRPFKNQSGENEADFVNCVAWRKQAENLATYMKKGNLVGITGRIQTRTYEGKDGKTVFVTEVMADNVAFLEKSNQQGSNAPQSQGQGQGNFPQQNQQQGNFQNQQPLQSGQQGNQQQGNFQQQGNQQQSQQGQVGVASQVGVANPYQQQGNFQQQQNQQPQQNQNGGGQMQPIDINDADLPF